MSGYIGASPVPQATQHRQAFTATAGQTSFATAGFTPQFVDVYLNGIKLAAEDYVAENGSDIVLTTGAALDDILEYVAYTPFEVASQTFTGTTTVAQLEVESATPRIMFTDTDGTDKWTSILEGNGNTYYISRNGANRGQHIWEQVDGGVYTHAMRIDASGNVLVGTTNADPAANNVDGCRFTATLGLQASSNGGTSFNRTASNGTAVSLRRAGVTVGTISVTGSATAYNTSSDYRLKENITPVQGAADIVKAMQPVTYTFKSDGSWHDGFLAHELQELHPRAVVGSKDAVDEEGNPEYQGVDYSKLTPILTAALQEALNKIDALETRLAELEATS